MDRTLPVRDRRASGGILLLLLALFVLGTLLAPAENTLGNGIRIVYVHVALMWTGMLGLAVAGALGALLALRPTPRRAELAYTVAVVGFGFFVAGTIASIIAQQVAWGGIAWDEPRTRSALQVVAASAVVLALAELPVPPRLHGTAFALLAAFMVWVTERAPLAMHPADPITPSSAWGIKLAFYGLFAVSALAALWLVVTMTARARARR